MKRIKIEIIGSRSLPEIPLFQKKNSENFLEPKDHLSSR